MSNFGSKFHFLDASQVFQTSKCEDTKHDLFYKNILHVIWTFQFWEFTKKYLHFRPPWRNCLLAIVSRMETRLVTKLIFIPQSFSHWKQTSRVRILYWSDIVPGCISVSFIVITEKDRDIFTKLHMSFNLFISDPKLTDISTKSSFLKEKNS